MGSGSEVHGESGSGMGRGLRHGVGHGNGLAVGFVYFSRRVENSKRKRDKAVGVMHMEGGGGMRGR